MTARMNQNSVEAVRTRSLGACERCGTTSSTFWSLHHRRPRGMGGTKRADVHSVSNLIFLCGSGTDGCHGWVESHREDAYDLGLLLRQYQTPPDVPVTLRVGRVLLDDEGGWQRC